MLRRILVIRAHQSLANAAQAMSFKLAAQRLETSVGVKGLTFDDAFHPVRVRSTRALTAKRATASGFRYQSTEHAPTFCVRADFEDSEAVARMRRDRPEVIADYPDLPLALFPGVYCGASAVGDASDVAAKLGVPSLTEAGLTGAGVRVAVVDGGISANIVPVAGGWAPPGSAYKPGSAPPGHGTMCAYDVRIAAPQATILDYALFSGQQDSLRGFLSDAIAAFSALQALLASDPGPLVVNNSWGVFDRSDDEPVGSSTNYCANPDHPLNQITAALVAEGADVFFAAGNCGEDCPDARCGVNDHGPGRSIHGANSHPDVLTVAAVTVRDERLGYSAQGPGALYDRKPDLAGYSHFHGSAVESADTGTSAACPVAAGVAAALRQRLNGTDPTPAQLKGLLQRTARDLGRTGWSYDLGYGVIDAAAALAHIASAVTSS